jgi:hypothetical protein
MSTERTILVAAESGISIRSRADITDAVGACFGAGGLLVTEGDVAPDFFDLRSGFAGELIQKFVNYQVRAAIVVPTPEAYGERFAELAREHATHPTVRFVGSVDEAMTWLRS